MQAKSTVRITATDGRIFAETAKVVGERVTVKGQALQLDPAKVKSVTLETKASDGQIKVQPCRITSSGAVKVGAAATAHKANGNTVALSELAPAGALSTRPLAAVKAKGGKPGPYDGRAQASLSRNDERKGWELRLRKGDQLNGEQLAQLRLVGWRWYGGRLQAFCLAEKYVSREALTLAQGLVTGFNSGALKAAAGLETFAAEVAAGTAQGSSALGVSVQ